MATKHIPINPNQYPTPAGPQQSKTVHYDPNQYDQPAGPARPTSYQKIRQSVHNAAQPVASVANDIYDAGEQAIATGHEIGQNPRIQAMRRQDGFTAPVQGAPRSPQSRQQYQGAPVDQGSVMHPGNTTYIIKCTNGQCEMTQRRQRPPRAPRAQRGYAVGLLGGNDPGL